MNLRTLIAALEAADPTKVVPVGFHRPHSYRGYYENLAFEPKADVTVAEMLACAKSALGQTFQGYKGGDYTMGEYTTVWVCHEGTSFGDGIGPVLLSYMLGQPAVPKGPWE
jgi:hypothetical protein